MYVPITICKALLISSLQSELQKFDTNYRWCSLQREKTLPEVQENLTGFVRVLCEIFLYEYFLFKPYFTLCHNNTESEI